MFYPEYFFPLKLSSQFVVSEVSLQLQIILKISDFPEFLEEIRSSVRCHKVNDTCTSDYNLSELKKKKGQGGGLETPRYNGP